jgi:hypothetical protein
MFLKTYGIRYLSPFLLSSLDNDTLNFGSPCNIHVGTISPMEVVFEKEYICYEYNPY